MSNICPAGSSRQHLVRSRWHAAPAGSQQGWFRHPVSAYLAGCMEFMRWGWDLIGPEYVCLTMSKGHALRHGPLGSGDRGYVLFLMLHRDSGSTKSSAALVFVHAQGLEKAGAAETGAESPGQPGAAFTCRNDLAGGVGHRTDLCSGRPADCQRQWRWTDSLRA